MKELLTDTVLKTIGERGLAPRPRWHFLLKNWIFWFLAGSTVVLGGIAVAIIIFVFFDHEGTARTYLNQSLVQDILLTIPYIWLVSLALLVALTRLLIHNVKQGYRYSIRKVLVVTLSLSILFGFILNAFELGDTIHEYLNETIPYYNSLVYTSKDGWSQPSKGLLGGTVLSIASTSELRLQDFHHIEWRVDISTVEYSDDYIDPKVGDVIKMVGTETGKNTFQPQQLFPWRN